MLSVNNASEVSIQTTSLDAYLKREGLSDEPIAMLKMDVEGYEYRVLRGAVDALARTNMLITEYSPSHLEMDGVVPASFVDFVSGFGFFPHLAVNEQLVPVDIDYIKSKREQFNLVWCR